MVAAMRTFIAALLASIALSAPALGDDIKGTLKDFGLIGTWSPDCSKDMSQPRASRAVFAAPSEGDATATVQDNRGEAQVTTVYQIVETAILDGGRLKVGLHPVTVTKSDGKAASQHDYDNLHIVFQKAGPRLEVIGVQFEGLPEVQRANFFEHCPG